MMPEDLELSSMSAVLSALEPLGDDERARVIAWATQKLAIAGPQVKGPATSEPRAQSGLATASAGFSEFHELFDASNPKSDVERALVGGYWIQICQASPDFSSRQVHDGLKQLGHPLTNITRAFDHLQEQKPVLSRQVQKTGKSKQGRKRYKLTREGEARVLSMIRGERSDKK
jgi:hypothetical protein